jgi:hypothetical protein
VRLKDDGSLELDWRDPPAKTPEQENEELLNDILRTHPNLTREEAQEQIDLFG